MGKYILPFIHFPWNMGKYTLPSIILIIGLSNDLHHLALYSSVKNLSVSLSPPFFSNA